MSQCEARVFDSGSLRSRQCSRKAVVDGKAKASFATPGEKSVGAQANSTLLIGGGACG